MLQKLNLNLISILFPFSVSENDVTPIQACPNNEERSCCPVTFNVGKRCPAHPGAIPRINPCGGCKTEWFNKDGNKVDCLESKYEYRFLSINHGFFVLKNTGYQECETFFGAHFSWH